MLGLGNAIVSILCGQRPTMFTLKFDDKVYEIDVLDRAITLQANVNKIEPQLPHVVSPNDQINCWCNY